MKFLLKNESKKFTIIKYYNFFLFKLNYFFSFLINTNLFKIKNTLFLNQFNLNKINTSILIINLKKKNFKYFSISGYNIFFLSNNQIFKQFSSKTNIKEKTNFKSLKFLKFNFLFVLKSLKKNNVNNNNIFFFLNICYKNYLFFFNIFSLSNIFLNFFSYFFFLWTPKISKTNFFRKKKSIKKKLKKNFIYNSALF